MLFPSAVSVTALPHRGVVRVTGPDRTSFLQTLLSNDVTKSIGNTAIYAALLTPQGKFLHDVFVLDDGQDGYLLDCERGRADDLLRRLTAYRLRAKVSLDDVGDRLAVYAAWGDGTPPPGTAEGSYADPRLPQMGLRILSPADAPPLETATLAAYNAWRFACGAADGSRDLEIEKSTLAEGNFDHLHGIDWKKGCYVGQELTARMHYRGLAKKRLFPVRIDGQPGDATAILRGDQEVGQLRSHNDYAGLALLTLDAARDPSSLACGAATVTATWPSWLPQPESNKLA